MGVVQAFGLLSAKTKPLYKVFWKTIKEQLGPDVAPRTLVMDLEQGAYLAFRDIFEVEGRTVDIQFFYFHFERAIMDKLAKKQCKQERQFNPVFNRSPKLL